MHEKEYYKEIETYIKRNEINKRRRALEENYDTLKNYWEIGRLLVEAQGGKEKAKYGDELIKKWSIKYTKNYGSGYNYTNLSRFRQFYLSFPILATLWQLSWSIIKILLPISDVNRRNYYFNLSIEQNLSVRQLQEKIKSESYERLINKPEHIELILPKKNIQVLDGMKNPIIIKMDKNKKIKSEKDLEIMILSELAFFFEQLGGSFSLVGNQYKISKDSKNYYIDLLLLNYKLNCFIVVELKLRKLLKEDKAQVEFYMKLVDEQIKVPYQNKTIVATGLRLHSLAGGNPA